MTVMEGDDRVEIELTPNDPRRRHPARPQPDAGSDGHPGAERTLSTGTGVVGRTASPSRRTAVVAAAVGIGALVVGWTIGRATTDAPDAPEAPGVGAAASVATTETDDTDPTLPAVETSTSVRPRPTTTTLVPIETSQVEINSALAGAPYELVGLTYAGELVEIDLGTGEMTVRRDLGISGSGGPVTIWAGADWTLLPNWNIGRTVLVAAGDGPRGTDLGPPWALIESETPGRFWVVDDDVAMGLDGSARLMNQFGEPTGASIQLSEQPRFGDPLGGLVVVAAGSTYRVDVGGVTKIADGEAIALDTERAFARLCDDDLVCRYVVVDRATGDVRDVPTDVQIGASTRYLTDRWPASDSTKIAPDGHTAAVSWTEPDEGTQPLGLIDLDTGKVTVLSQTNDGAIRWSPDGRFAFYLDAGLPMAYDLTSGEPFVIANGFPRLDALAIRAGVTR